MGQRVAATLARGKVWRRATYRNAALLAVLVSWLSAWMASADANNAVHPSEPPGYREAIAGGLQEFELGNFAEAREQFARAHALMPSARTLRSLGMTEFELRNYVEAVAYLEQALASRARPLEGTLLQDTEALLSRARTYVGEVALRVEPASASLVVDGLDRHQQAPVLLPLKVGDHLLEFEAPGHLSQRRTLQIRGGQSQTLKVQLASLNASAARGDPTPPEPRDTHTSRDAPKASTPLYKRWWLWTTVAIVAAGAATGVALALTADRKNDTYEAVPTTNTPTGVQLHPLWTQP